MVFFSYTFGFIKLLKFGVAKQVEENESLELSLWEGNKDYFISHAAWCLVVYTIRISMEAIKHSRKKNKHKSIAHLVIANHLNRLKGHIKCIITRDD